ncbi:MAG: DUF126 domain-containing protein [Proteobacteria bacterium]|nr:DUF126 domain-containing protein [Pseudomonadota bacterium]
MKMFTGKPIIKGLGSGTALVTKMPINFTAAFTKIPSFLPYMNSVIMDRHHELFYKRIKNRVLVFPACIGSTGTGLLLLQIITTGGAPSAIIVQEADSLLVSGIVLSDVWFNKSFPVIEYGPEDIYEKIKTGDRVDVDGQTGEIRVTQG